MRRVLLGLLVLVLAYFAVTTTLVARWMGKDERPRVDAIVVLGAAQYDGRPSAIYEARLEHAVQLWRDERGAAAGVHRGQGAGRPLHRGRVGGPLGQPSAGCRRRRC